MARTDFRKTGVFVLLMLLAGWLVEGSVRAEGELRVATFSADITPRLGSPVGQGFIPILKTAEHPLQARGILLQDSGVKCVICALDLMEIHNESYDLLRRTISRAAGVSEQHVALHCLHQHTAPCIDMTALNLERAEEDPRRIATADYLSQTADDISAAITEAEGNWQVVTGIGTGKSRAERVASNRRIERDDGTIQGRSSNTKSNPELRELAEGVIDPWVRTIALSRNDRALVHLHYYASHPQSFYGDGRVSYDVPGIIRERLEQKTGAFQLYLTGCGGDIAFGKYNDGTERARNELVQRLQSAVIQSISSADGNMQKVTPLRWDVRRMLFPLRTDEPFSEAANQLILQNSKASEAQRRKAAIALAWIQRVKSDHAVDLSCLTVGNVKLLHLPGEPFVQFQLAAQKMQPNAFVCVAGYGDCGMGYIGGDRIYTDRGGYEQTYAFAGPCEQQFLNIIRELLSADR